jgi:predicted RNase H-like nuclease
VSALARDATVIGIDMPLGLPDDGTRRPEALARRLLQNRKSSVFNAPVRGVLATANYDEANEVSRRRGGVGLSKQSYGLVEKIREVDCWHAAAPCRVVEIHPEVAFSALTGSARLPSKKSWLGALVRLRALAKVGLVLEDALDDQLSRAAVDDVLDAAVVAWSARRVARGEGISLPPENEAEKDATGVTMAIWY